MRLITWNCQGALRKKIELLKGFEPDILIVPESEHPDKLTGSFSFQRPGSHFWHGDSLHKGIGIYSFSGYKIELRPEFNPEFRYIIPLRITQKRKEFTLLAIWAMDNKEQREARYIGQIWLAINYYSELLNSPIILAGDFNSNKIWDRKGRVGNHSDVVRNLEDRNIHSIYHRHFEIEQGKEKHPTFFLQRNVYKQYHIDYCFLSDDLMAKVKSIEIGSFEDWIAHSDHVPIFVEIDY